MRRDGSASVRRARRITRRRWVIFCAAVAVTGRARPADKPRRIGVMGVASRPNPGVATPWDAFLAGMRGLGYEEGRDFAIEWKVTGNTREGFARAAAELVAERVDLIRTFSTDSTLAAKNATSTIPIVFSGLSDPVTSGLVPALARPGGNLTGTSSITDELHGKRLSLLREVLPDVGTVAVLWSPRDVSHRSELAQTEAAARRLAIQTRAVELNRVEDVEPVFEQLARQRPGAVLLFGTAIQPAGFYDAVFSAAATARLPAFGISRLSARAGALLTYGADIDEVTRRAAAYVDRIFKGAKPADLPIEQPTKFELWINLKTANAIGVTIPKDLLLRADEVIR